MIFTVCFIAENNVKGTVIVEADKYTEAIPKAETYLKSFFKNSETMEVEKLTVPGMVFTNF